MSVENAPKRVPYVDHPDRCQGNQKGAYPGHEGQCMFFKVQGDDYCQIHGGNLTNVATRSLNLYRIKKFDKRLGEFKIANGSRTIDEELALLRMMLEETVNKCEDSVELMLYSTKISEIIRDIKSLVLTADKLATKAGQLIGRNEAIVIAAKVIEIITAHISDPAILTKIGDDVALAFLQIEVPEEE